MWLFRHIIDIVKKITKIVLMDNIRGRRSKMVKNNIVDLIVLICIPAIQNK